MSAARPVLSAASCSHCRFLMLSLFIGNAPRSAPAIQSPYSYAHASVVGVLPIRRFSSLPKKSSPTSDADCGRSAHIPDEGPEDGDAGTAVRQSKSTGVPWYLQVEPPTHVAAMEPQPLPDIPPESPPLIGSLLKYASEEIGLDDLSLLDLRKLDPPPALGPNLFMLFGTARSERHLNVSAGRLVRWLRAKHRVHADADGLLGPNERKTKLRRKARRAKLLGTTGTDDADDGIRTGWICVNLGTIDRNGPESAVIGEDGRFSGFGVSQTGSTIIFQIMVESRRAELGLEKMWTEALERSLPPSPKSYTAHEDGSSTRGKSEDHMDEVERAILSDIHRPPNVSGGRKGHFSGVGLASNQARFYSTGKLLKASATVIDPLNTPSPAELAHLLTYDPSQKKRLLDMLREQLNEMDAPAARAALGRHNDGSPSTSFLELMGLAMHTLSPAWTWGYRLAVQHKAIMSGVPGTIQSLNDLRLLVEELRIYGIQATRDQYLQLVSSLFSLKEIESNILLELAFDVLSTMHQRNQPVMASDLIVTIIEAVSVGIGNKAWVRGLITRLEKLLFLPKSWCMDEPLLIRLMAVHANQSRWSRVWNIWGVPPRYLLPRSAAMYSHIFELAAASGSTRMCAFVLRRCLQEMYHEQPPVHLVGEVRQAVLKCVHVADPGAQALAELAEDSSGHMGSLARREFVQLARALKTAE
ncbi:hypothetical protein F4861DRAFT_301156 [Xylaria intraflava]|nr:hypothetical protein F4861DRAFT_301156 [Xylaria intraflava]